jgi:hypothetical protein
MEISGQLHATAALHPREEPPGHVEDEAGWVPEPAWRIRRREKKKTLASLGIQTPGLSTPQPSYYVD